MHQTGCIIFSCSVLFCFASWIYIKVVGVGRSDQVDQRGRWWAMEYRQYHQLKLLPWWMRLQLSMHHLGGVACHSQDSMPKMTKTSGYLKSSSSFFWLTFSNNFVLDPKKPHVVHPVLWINEAFSCNRCWNGLEPPGARVCLCWLDGMAGMYGWLFFDDEMHRHYIHVTKLNFNGAKTRGKKGKDNSKYCWYHSNLFQKHVMQSARIPFFTHQSYFIHFLQFQWECKKSLGWLVGGFQKLQADWLVFDNLYVLQFRG